LDKKTSMLSKKTARLRGWIQAAATLLTNIHIPNLFKGKIYQGSAKTVCVPGLNCYSCPAATGACPIGAFQAVVGSSKFKFSYYITGFFILLGVTFGRFICGFLCPFGWLQDLLHKIPTKKVGSEIPTSESPISQLAQIEFFFKATNTPRGIPMNVATMAEKNASSSVAGIFSLNKSTTGVPWRNDIPKSPWRVLAINAPNCFQIG
jgi:hypothetical protein